MFCILLWGVKGKCKVLKDKKRNIGGRKMVKLDYQTNNPRWGWSGLEYTSWINYAFALGYLSNIVHYQNSLYNGLIEIHVEGNDQQGAWGKEGRIHYYGTKLYLKTYFPDWNENCSAGRKDITCRINSNDYIYSLVDDYSFVIKSYKGKTTRDIFPPDGDAYNIVLSTMLNNVPLNECSRQALEHAFASGWNLR